MTQLHENQPFAISHAGGGTFAGEGLRAGSRALQPPGIRHRELRHSDDMELIEITAPARFATRDEPAP